MNERKFIKIGRLGRPHGVQGNLRFYPLNEGSVALCQAEYLYLGDEKLKHKISKYKKGVQPIVMLDGLNTPELVKCFVNDDVFLDREDMPRLSEDEFYFSDLIGFIVLDSCGVKIGNVDSFYSNGAQEIVVLTSGIEFPALKDVFIKSISIEEKVISLCFSREDLVV